MFYNISLYCIAGSRMHNLPRLISLARHSVVDNRNSKECFGAWHGLILPFVSLPVKCVCFEKGPHHVCLAYPIADVFVRPYTYS
jgi:hypothetical protein